MKLRLGVFERPDIGSLLSCVRFNRLTLVFLCVPMMNVKVCESEACQSEASQLNEASQLKWSDPLDWQDVPLYRVADLKLIELAHQAENQELALWALKREGVVSKAARTDEFERRIDQETRATDRFEPMVHRSPGDPGSRVHQRLRQLLEWQAIQRIGFYPLMLTGRWDESLQLSPKDLAAFETDYRASIRELKADCLLMEKRIRDELLAVLTESQKRQWDSRFGCFEVWDESMHIGPGRLLQQLRHSFQAAVLNETLGVRPDLETDHHLVGFGDHVASGNWVESLVRRSDAQRELAFSSEQTERFEQHDDPARRWLDRRDRWTKSVQADGGKPATNATRLGRETTIDGFNIPSDLVRALEPEQERKLREMIQWNHFRRVGWLPVLTDGSLGHLLGVSSKQRSKLFSKAKKLQDEVIHAHSEMVEKFLRRATRSFSKKQRGAFFAMLGDLPSPPLLLQPSQEIGFFHRHLYTMDGDLDGEIVD